MTEEQMKKRLAELASQVPDSYADFVTALPLFAMAEGVAPQVIEFIEKNPEAKSDDILDYLDEVSEFDGSPLEIDE